MLCSRGNQEDVGVWSKMGEMNEAEVWETRPACAF